MFGRYLLLNQLGAGRDGTRNRAFDPETKITVEIRSLNPLADPLASSVRSKRLRVVAFLRHVSALRVLELVLEGDRPFVVLEWAAAPRPGHPSGAKLVRPLFAAALAAWRDLAEGLAEGHHLGLVHGRLGLAAIEVGDGRPPKIDWTGLHVNPGDVPDGDLPFRAPEQTAGTTPDPPMDMYALGALLARWLGNAPEEPSDAPALKRLIDALRAADPLDRPSAREAADQLGALVGREAEHTVDQSSGVSESADSNLDLDLPWLDAGPVGNGPRRERLGRYALHEQIGEGGMGTVYRGEDLVDRAPVAVKVLRDRWVQRPDALRRFRKEARLLAEINNPNVTNLIEVNEDDGVVYIVMEYVDGTNMACVLAERGKLDERSALAIAADVARGLAAAHERGIIHRDVKPENILWIDGSPGELPRVKLSDFGLARHVLENESLNLTQPGAILGTPLYMPPEQSSGAAGLGPPADVYALGATLYHLMAGRPPFAGGSALSLIAMHRDEPPPTLAGRYDGISEGAGQVVAKALAKRPEDRYPDAGALLEDLERLLRGEPTAIDVHPVIPACDPRDLVPFEFRWELDAPPALLWPYVSNTERVNRALGLPAVPFRTEHDPDEGVRRFGSMMTAGITIDWREHPYEWVEGRRMGVLRVFKSGPFRWFVSSVELAPRAGGGTLLTHRVRIAANGLVGRALAALKVGRNGRRAMDQVYRRIDAAVMGRLERDPLIDPFEPSPALSKPRRRRIEVWVDHLVGEKIDPAVAERLGDFLAQAPPQDVARIRPLQLARRLGLDADQVVAACLRGAHDGTLILLWDLLCPVCRIPSQVLDTLRALRDHARCEACHRDFHVDFAHSVELIFRAHPEVREAELGVFCIGGPAHSPHVVAQVRVGPGERAALDLALGEGCYRLRGPQLPYSIDFWIDGAATGRRWELNLIEGPAPSLSRSLKPGGQTLTLANTGARELVVRVERTTDRDDAFTAARAAALPLFRELFPSELLDAGHVINVTTVTVVATALEGAGTLYQELGDARAFALLYEQFRLLEERFQQHGGVLVKIVHEGAVAVFPSSVGAVAAALELAPALAQSGLTRDLRLRAAVHRGPAMVATWNDHLDYFGATLNTAGRLAEVGAPGAVVVSPAVAVEPAVAALLHGGGLATNVVAAPGAGLAEGFAHQIVRCLDEDAINPVD